MATFERASSPGTAVEAECKLAAAALKRAYMEHPDLRAIVPALLAGGDGRGVFRLDALALTAGVPMKPMLGKITRGIEDVLAQLAADGDFSCTLKYDGEPPHAVLVAGCGCCFCPP